MDAPKRPSRPSVHGRIYKHLGKPQDIGFAAEDSGLLRHSIDSSTCRGNGYSDPSEAQSSPPSLPKTNFRASTSSYIPSRGDEDEMRITGSRRVHYDSDDDDDDVYMTGSCSVSLYPLFKDRSATHSHYDPKVDSLLSIPEPFREKAPTVTPMETKPNPTRSPRPSKTTEKETYALSKYAPRDSPRSPTRFSSKVFGENTRNVIRSAHPSKIGAVEVTQILNPNFSSSSKDDVAMETNQGPRSSSPSKDFDMETGRRSRSLSRSSHRSANAYSSRSCNRFSERSSSPSRDIEMETALNDENVDLAWEVAAKAMTPDDMSEDPTTGGDVPGNHDDEIFSTAPVYREVSPTLAPLPQKEQKRKRSSSVSSVPVVQEPQDSLVSIASLGDVLITLNRPVKAGEDSKETAPVLEIKCASPDMSKAATGPAWKSLLSTGTKVNVPHTDDEFGLLFMLRVAHDRDLSKVYDSEFTLDQILGVTSMVHKYNASSNVRQELVARIPTAWKDPMHFVDRPEAARWLFVSWIFGFHATFQNLLRVLVRQTCVNQDGDLVDKNGNLLTGTFPTAVLGHIRETRMRYLQRLISTTYDYAEKLCDAETRTCTATSSTHDWEDCASLLTGSFLNGLGKIGFGLKMPAIDTIEYSINETEAKLRGTKGHQPTNSDQLSSFGKFHYVGLGCGEDIGGDLIPNCQNKCVVPAPGSSP